jgi:hypothetical protein
MEQVFGVKMRGKKRGIVKKSRHKKIASNVKYINT